jgi:hypothetical protein
MVPPVCRSRASVVEVLEMPGGSNYFMCAVKMHRMCGKQIKMCGKKCAVKVNIMYGKLIQNVR